MNARLSVLLAIVSSLFGQTPSLPVQRSAYEVCEVFSVRSLSQFECKLKGYPYAASARFSVQIRDVVLNPQIPPEEATEYLYERLKSTDHIILEKIEFRNYFRLIADVRVDGRNLLEELVQQRLALPVEQPKETLPDAVTPAENPARTDRPVLRYSSANIPPAKKQTVTLQRLLETEVDLSGINEETTVEESLQILSDSVRPWLPFVILWNDLEANALIEKETPVGIGGFGRMKLKQGLEIILHSLSTSAETKLVLAIEGQVVTLGTRRGLLPKSMVHCYSVEDILSIPSDEDSDNRTDNNDNFDEIFQR